MAEGTGTAAPAAVAAGKGEAAKPIAGAPGSAAAAPAAKADEATQEFIVNGKPVKLTAAQVKIAVQKGLFADQKLKSIDSLKSSTERIVAALKTPEGVLGLLKDKSLGNSPKAVLKALLSSDAIDDEAKEDLSQWVYQNVVKKAQLTPEQIENEKKLTDYERLKKQEDERKQREVTEQQKAQVQQVYQAVRAEVTKQIVADKTFPQTEGSVRQVIEKLRVMNKKGAPINAENVGKALALVKKDHVLHQQTMFDALEDPEGLIALIGEARALKISKALVARLKAKSKAKPAAEAVQEGEGREKVTERIDKKLGRTAHGYHVLNI
jgi:hypothetical protein